MDIIIPAMPDFMELATPPAFELIGQAIEILRSFASALHFY